MSFKPTRTQYLVKHETTGIYYAAKKVGKYLRRRSLKTKSETIAKALLASEITSMQQEYGQAARDAYQMTFGEFAAAYIKAEMARTDLRQGGKDYRKETLKMLAKTWPGYEGLVMRRVTLEDVRSWAERSAAKYSPPRFNGLLDTVRGIMALAHRMHVLPANLALEIPRKPVPIVSPELPSSKQFARLVSELESHYRSRRAAIVVRLLAYTGLRIGNARLLTWEHVDLKNGWLHAPPFKFATSTLKLPIIPEARPLFEQLVADSRDRDGQLMPIKDPRTALETAYATTGIKMTSRLLRHYFATKCLESGVDVKTVAGWLGHKDGGALLLKRYAHLRDEHSQNMAQKVKFN